MLGAPSTVETYASDMSFVGKVAPQFVVKVDTAEVIQALVRAAKETVTPLVPVSSGRAALSWRHSAGDRRCHRTRDMSGMKKIDWISRTERVAVFEPGVTFGELIPAVAKEGLRLNMPLRPRSTKSVIGSMLSREPVILPRYHWDVGDPLGSTEVIFGHRGHVPHRSSGGPRLYRGATPGGRRSKRGCRPIQQLVASRHSGFAGYHGCRNLGLRAMRSAAAIGGASLRWLFRTSKALRGRSLAGSAQDWPTNACCSTTATWLPSRPIPRRLCSLKASYPLGCSSTIWPPGVPPEDGDARTSFWMRGT